MNRLYAVESTPTLTGAIADNRLPLRRSEIEGFARAVAGAVGGGAARPGPEGTAGAWVASVAKDLKAHAGRSLVIAGDYQSPAVHALAHEINQWLGNVGQTVVYGAPVEAQPVDTMASLAELAADMKAGRVGVLVVLGSNPVYSAPPRARSRGPRPRLRRPRHHHAAAHRAAVRPGAIRSRGARRAEQPPRPQGPRHREGLLADTAGRRLRAPLEALAARRTGDGLDRRRRSGAGRRAGARPGASTHGRLPRAAARGGRAPDPVSARFRHPRRPLLQ